MDEVLVECGQGGGQGRDDDVQRLLVLLQGLERV